MFYLCFDGTWVHVMTEKDLLRLIYVYGNCCLLPVFWLYLGTCYGRKDLFELICVFTIYLCLGGTWVHVVTEKGLLGLA